MKNRKFYLLSLLVILYIAVCSCRDDREEIPATSGSIIFPTTEDTQPIFPSKGGTASLSFTATGDWTATTTDTRRSDWVTVEPSFGNKGEVQIAITLAPNETSDNRSVAIALKCGTNTDTISVYQVSKDAIVVARDEYQFNNEGGELNFKVQSNVEFDVMASESWIQQISPSMKDAIKDNLSFTILPNATNKNRQGNITIKEKEGNKQQIIIIKQTYGDSERAALITFYKATNGDNWINKTNWCSDKPINEWYGITTVGSLYSLNLGNNNLTGIVPKEIGKLINFSHITLWDNQLSGEIPKEIGELINLRGLYLNNNKLSGKIPDEIWTLPSLAFLHLSGNELSGEISSAIQNAKGLEQISLMNNLLTGTLPNEIYKLRNLTELSIDGNQFDGNISENIGQLTKLRRFSAAQTGLKGEIPNSIYQLYSLEELILNGNSLSGRISENIENLQKLDLFDISNNNITGNIPKNIGNIKSLTRFLVNGNNIEGNIPEEFVDLPLLKLLWLFGNRLQGSIPGKLLRSPKWKTWIPTFDILPQQNGYTLLEEDFYASSDFSKDGEITILQTHTKGNGIKLVVMGDLFVDTDMESGGKYETMMKKAVENYFSVEPFKSLREYYDVVSIKAVSKNDLMSGESAFETKWTTQFYGDENKCQEYARKALGVSNLDNIQVIMVLNVCIGMANCSWYTNSFSIANCPYGGNSDDTFEELVHHEANGHGFGFLHDEYSSVDYGIISAPDIEAKQRAYNNYGWFANIDFTSDPSQVKWKHFINDSRYINESIGVFEGALFEKGIYRPTEFSIMRTTQGQFNAPSREAIYKRAMKLAYGDDWVYDYEKFVEFDVPARAATRSIPYPSRILKNTKHVPPIIYNYPAVPQ